MTATIHRLPQVAPVRPTGGSTVEAVAGFLADLEQARKSRETQRAYAADLRLLTAAAPSLEAVTPAALRELFAANAHLPPPRAPAGRRPSPPSRAGRTGRACSRRTPWAGSRACGSSPHRRAD